MRQVIQGLEEGLAAIAEALEGSGPDIPTPAAADEGKVLTAGDDGTASWEDATGGNVPTPTLSDEGKVLRVIPQGQETVAPGWDTAREVPVGGTTGQVLTKNADGYGWANASGGGSYPEPTYATDGQVLTADGLGGAGWVTPSGGGGSLSYIQGSININDWMAQTDFHEGIVSASRDLPYPYNIVSIYAWYSDGYGYYLPVPIDRIFYDSKSGELSIRIADTYYTPISTASATTYVEITYHN